MPTFPEKQSQKEFKLIPAGTHLARCYQFIHIGHVPNTFPGATSAIINKIRLTWELPEEMTVFKEGTAPQPFSISQDYTLSMNEKANLRKMIQSWTGRNLTDEEAESFDVESLVGMDCLITISHSEKNGKKYANIQNITKCPAKMPCPPQVNPSKVINWENINKETYDALPEFLKKKLMESKEYRKWMGIEEVAF